MLNDLVADADRSRAFAAFAAWLVPGGTLIGDVRNWDATARRYAEPRTHTRMAGGLGLPERRPDSRRSRSAQATASPRTGS